MLAQVIYDEYREWFSAIDNDGNMSIPIWEFLDDASKANWRRIAGVAENHVKKEIASRW